MKERIEITRGKLAESCLVGDEAEAVGIGVGGVHNEHHMKIRSAKYNCGAYDLVVQCECGAEYASPLHGCWNHRRQQMTAGAPLPPIIIEEGEIVWKL